MDWQQVRTYTDHLGHPVVLEQYVSPEYETDPDLETPIQVYSLVPLDDDHEELREYLMQTFSDDEVKPLFEIYSYRPLDGFACIEHNRMEIARRKQQHRSGVENPLPLIARWNRPNRLSNIGFCVLVRSHSYRVGNMEDSEEAEEIGEGPDLLYFNRTFSSTRADADLAQHSPEDNEDLRSEAFELSIERVTEQMDIGQMIILDLFLNVSSYADQRYALDVDEGEPPGQDMPTEEQILTNTPEGKTSDIQYVVHTSFLSHIRDTAGFSLLESTARLFTASVLSHLPANKILTLKLFIPKSNSWSAIGPAQNEVLESLSQQNQESQESPFPIGALHNILSEEDQPPAAKRVTPRGPEKYLYNWLPYESGTFTVVLDRAKFVSENGVHFYKNHCSKVNDSEVLSDNTNIVRGVNMSAVARRLGMVVLDE
ncbi:unnamed protein product [Penicillium salamii]|nr:unnamed protein product [Penicillium salamii]